VYHFFRLTSADFYQLESLLINDDRCLSYLPMKVQSNTKQRLQYSIKKTYRDTKSILPPCHRHRNLHFEKFLAAGQTLYNFDKVL